MIGLIGGAFRYFLLRADRVRDLLVYSSHAWPRVGWLLPVFVFALGAGLARLLVVRFAPLAAVAGSSMSKLYLAVRQNEHDLLSCR